MKLKMEIIEINEASRYLGSIIQWNDRIKEDENHRIKPDGWGARWCQE